MNLINNLNPVMAKESVASSPTGVSSTMITTTTANTSNTSPSGATQVIHNDEKRRFQWIVDVRSEFGNYRSDELQVRLTDKYIELVGLQQKWRQMPQGHARRSFEARQTLEFPLDERSVCVNETKEGSVCIQAAGSGLLQQLLINSSQNPNSNKPIIFKVTPFTLPITSPDNLLRALMGEVSSKVMSMSQNLKQASSKSVSPKPKVVQSEPIDALLKQAKLKETKEVVVANQTSKQQTPTSTTSGPNESKRLNVNDLFESNKSNSINPKPNPINPKSDEKVTLDAIKSTIEQILADQSKAKSTIENLMSTLKVASVCEPDSTKDSIKPKRKQVASN